ncbi:hypothetical protein CIPAW_06G162500 [Carya illinoinensis]|uniref:Uncharacterized protein n=1 Tax=Carya illinoinensis TaxID=32201 RepID=A0A8T1QCL5_CARIL|nr:hypothetical protein CIPAW_06G162500 [Carya illinoinensis]
MLTSQITGEKDRDPMVRWRASCARNAEDLCLYAPYLSLHFWENSRLSEKVAWSVLGEVELALTGTVCRSESVGLNPLRLHLYRLSTVVLINRIEPIGSSLLGWRAY